MGPIHSIRASESANIDTILSALTKTALECHAQPSPSDLTNVLCLAAQHKTHDLATLIESLQTLADSPPVEAKDTAEHLGHIAAQLQSGTLRLGVVGLTKAGKSTTLNALLGDTFLPSSLQPQTAKQVNIIHDPSVPDGALYAIYEESDDSISSGEEELVASGVDEIPEYLYQGDKNISENKTVIQTLIFRVPFPFLKDAKGIKLEISDMPSLFEATSNESITAKSKMVLRERFAFVVILNLKLLKTKEESELLKTLTVHHPELLAKQKRTLILINTYDVAFQDTNPESIKPDDISQYISDYLAEPEILNIALPAENILPFNALWALRARLWTANPLSLLNSHNANNLYEESLITLRRAGFSQEVESLSTISESNIKAIALYLLKFSKIETIEARLREMLQQQSPQILQEDAIVDSLTTANKLLTLISQKVDELELSKKEMIVAKHEELVKSINDLKLEYTSRIQNIPSAVRGSITAEVSSVISALRGAIDAVVRTQLTNHLQGYHGNENRQVVFGRICEVKGLVNNPVHSQMTKSWKELNSIVKNVHVNYIRGVISELKSRVSSILATDATVADEMPASVSAVLGDTISNLDKVDLTTLVSDFDVMSIHVDASSIPNDQLNHIWQKMETRYQTEKRTKMKKKWFKKKKKIWYESVPYQVPTYGPDINELMNIFSTQATNPWMISFQNRVDIMIAEISRLVSEQVAQVSHNVLTSAQQEVQSALDVSREAEHSSREMANNLMTSQCKVEDIKKQFDSMT